MEPFKGVMLTWIVKLHNFSQR